MIRKTLLLAVFTLIFAGQAFAQDTLAIGEPTQGEATGKALTYSVETETGKGYIVLVTSNDFDTYVAVETADGDKIGENEDFYDYESSFTYLSRLFFIAPSDGATLVLNANYGDFEGDFEVTVSEIAFTELNYGDTASLNSENTSEYLTFEGKAGDIIDLFAISAEEFGDTQLSLQFEGVEVAYDYDSGKNYDAYLHRYELTEDGLYVAILSGYSETPLSEVEITLNKTEELVLATGENLDVTLGADFDYEYLTVNFEAGTTYTLELSSASPSSFYVEVYLEGETYSSKYMSFTSLLKGAATFVADGSGKGHIKINSSNYEETEFTVSLSGE